MNLIIDGMDSSRWQDIPSTPQYPNFQLAYDRGLKFNYLKASQGVFTDQFYKIHWSICRKTPMLLGAYHFLQWDINPRRQAEYFYNVIKNDMGELPPVCDFEWWSTIPDNAFDILYNFLDRLRQLMPPNRKIAIYTAKAFWDRYGSKNNYWKQYLLWIARYGNIEPDIPKPWTKDELFLWQYTSKGDGLYYGMESKGLDLNKMDKDWYIKFGGKIEGYEPPKPPEKPEDELMKMVVISDTLRVRSAPNTNLETVILRNEIKGKEITVYDIAGKDSAWVKVHPTEEEWMCVENNIRRYLQKI